MSLVAFSDLRTAAYCPRKLYYARQQRDRGPPAEVATIRELAFRYEELIEASDRELAAEPIAVSPRSYRENLARARDSIERRSEERWGALRAPASRDVLATGRHCRGVVHKVLADPLAPSLVSAGRPPDVGVWEPQSVHAVAAAKALAWEHETPIEAAYVEYPAHGAIRRIELTTRRKATYRRALRTVRQLDGPPPRVRNRSKCEACEYAETCGVRTRTLRSLLGLG